MLPINLATIYQGRIPTLRHTQLHAETLSRSYLKYVLTGELDAYDICLIRELTNQACRIVRNPRTRNTTQAQSTTTTQNIPPPSHLPHHSLPAKEHKHILEPRPPTNPLPTLQLRTHPDEPVVTTLPSHTTTPRLHTAYPPLARNPSYNHH